MEWIVFSSDGWSQGSRGYCRAQQSHRFQAWPTATPSSSSILRVHWWTHVNYPRLWGSPLSWSFTCRHAWAVQESMPTSQWTATDVEEEQIGSSRVSFSCGLWWTGQSLLPCLFGAYCASSRPFLLTCWILYLDWIKIRLALAILCGKRYEGVQNLGEWVI